jgi:hypothetical protein
MTTTGTSVFNLDVNDLFEEAFERCGQEMRSGYDFRTARRSLNLLTIEWANRGINLWTVESGQISLYPNQAIYALPNDTIDLLDQVTRINAGSGTNQSDLNVNRISESTYSTIPNKYAAGRPIQVWIDRQSGDSSVTTSTVATAVSATDTTIYLSNVALLPAAGFITLDSELISYSNLVQPLQTSTAGYISYCGRGQQGTLPASHSVSAVVTISRPPSISIWPLPSQGSTSSPYYMFVYWRLRRIQDTGTGTGTQDIPFRFVECMVAGLAYKLSMKLPNVDPGRMAMLKAEYEMQWQIASEEDREKATLRVAPRMSFYR